MRLGFAYNQRPDTVAPSGNGNRRHPSEPDLPVDAFVEWDDPSTIHAVADALRVFGEVVLLEATGDFCAALRDARVDLLFNMAEGTSGPNRESHVPAIAEFLRVPYLGSDPLTLGLALHKGRAKEVFAQRCVPSPPYVLVESDADLPRLRDAVYPAFLKPVWEGSSKGIAEANLVETGDDAVERARYLLETYRQPILAEAFLTGDEYTVAVLGNNGDARALPLIRYRFTELPDGALPIMGYEAKWLWDQPGQPLGDVLECPAAVPEATAARVREVALEAYRALGCRDWSRVDVRLDADGVAHALEVNPLPGLMPDPEAHSCFPAAAAAAGMTYDELIQEAARIAWHRISGRELAMAPAAGVVS
jgi:D-alanine-D-alanine ligase